MLGLDDTVSAWSLSLLCEHAALVTTTPVTPDPDTGWRGPTIIIITTAASNLQHKVLVRTMFLFSLVQISDKNAVTLSLHSIIVRISRYLIQIINHQPLETSHQHSEVFLTSYQIFLHGK